METAKKTLLENAIRASIIAGAKILEVYEGKIEVEMKDDKSPLTLADKKSHEAIMEVLEKGTIPVLSEEGRDIAYDERKDWNTLWVVDPLDGTKEFIKRNGEFTVNIALVENGTPTMGVIYVPVTKELYIGAEGLGAYKLDNADTLGEESLDAIVAKSSKLPMKMERPYTMVGSRSHMSSETSEYFEGVKAKHPDAEIISKGSSLKICMVAEGSADVYPRFAPTMEWDTAAGHGIAKYAGLDIFNPNTDTPLVYNKMDLLNPWFIVKPV